MPCCEFHDRLDKKLTVHEYLSKECGSIKATRDAGSMGHPVDPATGKFIVDGQPEYCCFSCPNLIEKIKNTQVSGDDSGPQT